MNLLLINGSPKVNGSNTHIMLKAFQSGLNSKVVDSLVMNISARNAEEEIMREIEKRSHIIIAFPLYGNAMPAGLLELLERINERESFIKGKHLGFLIQYGFPEAIHGRPIEGYLKEWSIKQGAIYSGAIVKGGCDGLSKEKTLTDKHKTISGLKNIAALYASTGQMNDALVKEFAGIEKQKDKNQHILKVIVKLMNYFYWKKLLKGNNVSVSDSYAKPYGD